MDDKNKDSSNEVASFRSDENNTKGYLTLFYPKEQDSITLEEVLSFLREQNVNYGLNIKIIEDMISANYYFKEVLIAEGIPPINGTNGSYQFHFNPDPPQKPVILEDGSVDYNTLGKIELVEAGELLISYTKALPGTDGINIFGAVIPAKAGKDLPPLKGKGFEYLEEEQEYRSKKEGRAVWKNNRLEISDLYVVNGDVDATTGDIRFYGDVLVRGNVYSNTTIQAGGHITVNGHVETATLKAGKDIILKNGMQGADKGFVQAKGDVSAKFFEQCVIKANGNINANAILNCDVEADHAVIVSGKKGIIVGGETKATERIEASILGNHAEAKTRLVVGPNVNVLEVVDQIEEKIIQLTSDMDGCVKELNSITERLTKRSISLLESRRNELLRTKITYSAQILELEKKKLKLLDQRERSSNGKIIVFRSIYPNTYITINGANIRLTTKCDNVTFLQKMNDIKIYSNV